MVHVATDGAHLHDGPALPTPARMILCDTTGAIVGVRGGRPIDIGRRRHIVPLALRRTIELRDRGCRVPGCAGRRIQVHHLVHWEDGGPTDAHNLVGLCPNTTACTTKANSASTGNPTRPDGLTFTDRWGHPLTGRPSRPPTLNGRRRPSRCPTSPRQPGHQPGLAANASTPAGSPSISELSAAHERACPTPRRLTRFARLGRASVPRTGLPGRRLSPRARPGSSPLTRCRCGWRRPRSGRGPSPRCGCLRWP